MTTQELIIRTKNAAAIINTAKCEDKNNALKCMAEELILAKDEILSENIKDIEKSRGIISDVMIDRLMLTSERIDAMAEGIKKLITLPDPAWNVLSSSVNADGLLIEKTSCPFGLIAIIYESRPNVTSDAAALSVKSGNACILRGGKEAYLSSASIVKALKKGLKKASFPEDTINLVEDITRASAKEIMEAEGLVDLLIPRGGASLIKNCKENSLVPIIETGTGICHVYIDKDADKEKAFRIVYNAKTSRPSVCNACEVLLVHKSVAKEVLPRIKEMLTKEREERGEIPVKLKLCENAQKIISGENANENDFDTEFLDYILAVKIVDDLESAIEHINLHSTMHSEAIVTENEESAFKFTKSINSAAVYVNASTRFTDGGVFGLGCEMGISTQLLHARGPMGLSELNTYKYIIRGNGQIR